MEWRRRTQFPSASPCGQLCARVTVEDMTDGLHFGKARVSGWRPADASAVPSLLARQAQLESCKARRGTGVSDATVRTRDGTRNRQAETGALAETLSRRVRPVEAVE